MACAWATVACNAVMLLLSYLIGRRRYPVPYPLRKMAGYIALAALLFVSGMYLPIESVAWRLAWRTLLLLLYVALVLRSEGVLKMLKK